MPKIIIEKGNDKGKVVLLSGRGTLLVGRDPKAHITIADSMASRQHFKIFTKNEKFYLRDLGSSNGTFVNGIKVAEVELAEGDKLQIGETLMSFVNEKEGTTKDPMIGKVVEGYRIHERVGRGGMGTVYRATQLSLNRVVAFKVLSAEYCKDATFIELFRKEARAAGQLNHPSVVAVYDVGKAKTADTYYISMEFMAGGSIQDLIGRNLKLPVEEALPFFIDSAHGLEYAFKRGIVHRDIKPDNLMLNEDRACKIGDLGLALNVSKSETQKEEGVFGTPHYIAPEQALGKNVDIRADLYALGGTFYRILGGATPFTGPTVKDIVRKQIKEKAKPLSELAPELPLEICRIIHKLMEKEPAERYQTPTELLADLDAFKRKLENREPAAPEAAKSKTMRSLVAAAIVVLLLAIFGIVYSRVKPSNETPVTPPVADGGTDAGDDDDSGEIVSHDPNYKNWRSDQMELTTADAEHGADIDKLEGLLANVKLSRDNFSIYEFSGQVEKWCDTYIGKYQGLLSELAANEAEWLGNIRKQSETIREAAGRGEIAAAMGKAAAARQQVESLSGAWDGATRPIPRHVLRADKRKELTTLLEETEQAVVVAAHGQWEAVLGQAQAAEHRLETPLTPETAPLPSAAELQNLVSQADIALQDPAEAWKIDAYAGKAGQLRQSLRNLLRARQLDLVMLDEYWDAQIFDLAASVARGKIWADAGYDAARAVMKDAAESRNPPDVAGLAAAAGLLSRTGRLWLKTDRFQTAARERMEEFERERALLRYIDAEHLKPLQQSLFPKGPADMSKAVFKRNLQDLYSLPNERHILRIFIDPQPPTDPNSPSGPLCHGVEWFYDDLVQSVQFSTWRETDIHFAFSVWTQIHAKKKNAIPIEHQLAALLMICDTVNFLQSAPGDGKRNPFKGKTPDFQPYADAASRLYRDAAMNTDALNTPALQNLARLARLRYFACQPIAPPEEHAALLSLTQFDLMIAARKQDDADKLLKSIQIFEARQAVADYRWNGKAGMDGLRGKLDASFSQAAMPAADDGARGDMLNPEYVPLCSILRSEHADSTQRVTDAWAAKPDFLGQAPVAKARCHARHGDWSAAAKQYEQFIRDSDSLPLLRADPSFVVEYCWILSRDTDAARRRDMEARLPGLVQSSATRKLCGNILAGSTPLLEGQEKKLLQQRDKNNHAFASQLALIDFYARERINPHAETLELYMTLSIPEPIGGMEDAGFANFWWRMTLHQLETGRYNDVIEFAEKSRHWNQPAAAGAQKSVNGILFNYLRAMAMTDRKPRTDDLQRIVSRLGVDFDLPVECSNLDNAQWLMLQCFAHRHLGNDPRARELEEKFNAFYVKAGAPRLLPEHLHALLKRIAKDN